MSTDETLVEIELALQLHSNGNITAEQALNTITHLVRVNYRRNQ